MLRVRFFMFFLTLGSQSIRSFTLLQSAQCRLASRGTTGSILSQRLMTSSKSADELLTNQLEVPLATAISLHSSNNDQVVFLDGSWWLGQPERARTAFETGPRIAGSHFYDIDDVASTTPSQNPKGLPHMMPPPDLQAAYMDAIGVTNQHHVIVYGQEQCPFVHRAWYQIMCMGHGLARTHLLAGSLQDWISAGGPVDSQSVTALRVKDDNDNTNKARSYQAVSPASTSVVTMDELQHLIRNAPESIHIVDARSAERFMAAVDEPRPGLRRGHMPGAQNVPFQNVLQDDSLVQLRDVDSLTTMLKAQTGIDSNSDNDERRIIATCGSGATGCTVLAALVKVGYNPEQLALYDGSWMEWGADANAPLVDEREVKKE